MCRLTFGLKTAVSRGAVFILTVFLKTGMSVPVFKFDFLGRIIMLSSFTSLAKMEYVETLKSPYDSFEDKENRENLPMVEAMKTRGRFENF